MLRRLPPLPAAVAAMACGCTSVPAGRTAVDRVAIRGNDRVGDGEILGHIATRATPRFFGLFKGIVYDYALYTPLVLQRDLARIERLYRAHGYYQARVTAGRLRYVARDQVRVEIVVEEGPPVLTEQATVLAPTLPEDLRKELEAAVAARLPKDKPFDEAAFDGAEAELAAMLTDRGYAWARVSRSGVVDVVKSRAFAHYRVDPGPKAVFGAVTIVGNGEIPESRVRTALDIRPGKPYSTAALRDAQQALLGLGVFSSVLITPDLGQGPTDEAAGDEPGPARAPGDGPPRVPIRVELGVGKLRAAKLGGGIQLDALKSDLHVIGGWQSRNFLGGMRHFVLDGRAGVVLYPLRINNWVAPTKPLPEARLRAELNQPGLFEARTNGFVSPAISAYAVLLKTNPQPTDPVLGYLDASLGAGVERKWRRFYLSVRQHGEYAVPFAYLGAIDPNLRPVTLIYPELVAQLDFRDKPAEPHEGVWLGTTVESALFGTGRDVKLVPEVRGYVPLSKATLAARLRVGMLLPFDYGGTLQGQLDNPFAAKSADEVRDLQLMFFRGLFAGGTDSNRGYPARAISPHTIVPFMNPQVAQGQVSAECDASSPDFDASRCSVPIGGLTSWEASLELRFPIHGALGGALFCDSADVTPARMQFRFDHLHLACGTGARYVSPLGAIRLDVGYRIPGAQYPAGADPIVEGDPGTFFGAPINLSLGIGEVF